MASVRLWQLMDTEGEGDVLYTSHTLGKVQGYQVVKGLLEHVEIVERFADCDAKTAALARHLDVDPSTIEERSCADIFECSEEPGVYRVLSAEEADAAQREHWESFPDDTGMFDKWPEEAVEYFDRERWIRDQIQEENAGHGRGNSLASYDGDEYEQQIDGEWYFIYRIG